MFQGISKSPNTNGSLTMLTDNWQCSTVISKMELNELMKTKKNVFVSVTVQMDEVNNADGFYILFLDRSSLLTSDPIGMCFLNFHSALKN